MFKLFLLLLIGGAAGTASHDAGAVLAAVLGVLLLMGMSRRSA